jgi:hypothetical protein
LHAGNSFRDVERLVARIKAWLESMESAEAEDIPNLEMIKSVLWRKPKIELRRCYNLKVLHWAIEAIDMYSIHEFFSILGSIRHVMGHKGIWIQL